MKVKTYPLSMVLALLSVLCGILMVAILGSQGVTVAVQNRSFIPQRTIVIDAGHGGIDGGATSCTGVLERDINLEIALKLDDVMHLLGYHTVLTRSTQDSIATEGNTIAAQKVSDMKNRLHMVNQINDPIFISIHQNYFGDGRYHGAQVFYGNKEESKTLAAVLQRTLIQTINQESRRSIKSGSGIYLLEKLNCPAALIECGFLSNQEEEQLLRDKTYQNKLCVVIATAIGSYIAQSRTA